MRFLTPFLLLFAASPSLPAQPAGFEQACDLVTVPAGDKFLRWHGHAGRSYFVQISDASDPLTKWRWAPVIEAGNGGEISCEVDGTAAKGFFRLKYTNLPVPSGETLDTADFDGDGISNLDEIDPPGPFGQTDPLDGDTDRDALPDGWERAHGLDPNDGADAAGLFPGSDLTNLQAFNAGVRAHPNATPADKDGDACEDDLDAVPDDAAIWWPRTPLPRYALIETGISAEPVDGYGPSIRACASS